MPNTLGSFEVTRTQENEKKHLFQVDLGGDTFDRLVISTFKDIVSVEIDRADSADFGNSVGLMGQFGTGKGLARDGVTVLDDPNLFGQEWQGMFFLVTFYFIALHRQPKLPTRVHHVASLSGLYCCSPK
jgi:hypothetical protein